MSNSGSPVNDVAVDVAVVVDGAVVVVVDRMQGIGSETRR